MSDTTPYGEPDPDEPIDPDVPTEGGIEVPADGSWSPPIEGDGTGEALPPIETPEPA